MSSNEHARLYRKSKHELRLIASTYASVDETMTKAQLVEIICTGRLRAAWGM